MSEKGRTQLERVFLAASDLDDADRAAYLDSACAGDDALRQQVEDLLDAAERSEDYFGSLAARLGVEQLREGDAAPGHSLNEGDRFGPYRLTEPIGSGGMGDVWRAERSDGQFEGEVAVKVLTRRESREALERFRLEAQFLARLNHAGIAHLIDAGVEAGDVPYLILEYVQGEPIDAYCDAHALGVDARLRLFLDILDAVAHAHAHLIVHSDIKPSNVLVTHNGAVKLLDFGIANVLSEQGGRGASLALTPEYAAPEQFTGGNVSTATDVYALGMLLYVLLAGHNPREAHTDAGEPLPDPARTDPPSLTDTFTSNTAATLADIARTRGVSPTRLMKEFRGELDRMVTKALAPDAADRYPTAADFAADIHRYRRQLPLAAMPDSLNYRARKFVQRHRGGVLTATLTFVALVAAAIVTTWQAVEAKRQRDIAVRQQERVLATNEFLHTLLSELGPDGEKRSLQELLDRGVEVIDARFGDNENLAAYTLHEVSVMYGRLGERGKQIELLKRSEEIARRTGEKGLVASSLCAQARLQQEADPEASAAALAAGLRVRDSLPASRGGRIINCYRAEGLAASAVGEYERAIETYRAALDVIDASPVPSIGMRMTVLNDLTEQYYMSGRQIDALANLDEIVAMRERLGRDRSLNHVITLANRASVMHRLGEVLLASQSLRDALDRVDGLERPLVGLQGAYAGTLLRLARYDEALALLESDYAASIEAENVRRQSQIAMSLGRTLVNLGRHDEARRYLDEAETLLSASYAENHRFIANVGMSRALMMLAEDDREGALRAAQGVLTRLGYPDVGEAPGLKYSLVTAAEIALAAGEAQQAHDWADEALTMFASVARDVNQSADVGQALHRRAQARLALGDPRSAADDLRRAVQSLSGGFGADHPETGDARARLAPLDIRTPSP